MNQNELSTKLAVRALALELATKAESQTAKETIDRASVYADYIIGDNDMPEFIDSWATFNEIKKTLEAMAEFSKIPIPKENDKQELS